MPVSREKKKKNNREVKGKQKKLIYNIKPKIA